MLRALATTIFLGVLPQVATADQLRCDDGTLLQVEHIEVAVPVSYDEPSGATYRLAAIRVTHPDHDRSAMGTPVVFLAGGPGDSGIRVVESLVKHGGAEFLAMLPGDIVGIDERGVGASEPDLGGPIRYGIPPGPAGDPEEVLARIRSAHAQRAEMLRSRGVRTRTFHPEASARDVGLVLAQLGMEHVQVWGRSYGSHLAIAVDRLHPGLVDRLVLVGPEGPDHTLKLHSHVDAALARLDEAIARHRADAAATPSFSARLEVVLKKLGSAPVVAELRVPARPEPVEVGVSAWDIQMLVWNAMNDQHRVADLPRLLSDMERGEFSEVARIAGARRATMSLSIPMNRIMDLACGASPDRVRLSVAQAKDSLLGGVPNFGLLETGDVWDVHDIGQARWHGQMSGTPALIVVGDLDARTPIENIPDVKRVLPNSAVITVRNATHTFPLFACPELNEVLRRFADGQEVSSAEVSLPEIRF